MLSLGQSKDLPLKSSSVWIEDRKILKAEPLGAKLILKGLKEGFTTVRIGDNLYHIQVVHPGKRDILTDLHLNLKDIVGLNAEISEGDLLVTGRLYRMTDWLRLAKLARTQAVTYQMRAELSQTLQNESARFFSELLAKAHLPPQTLIFSPAPEIRITGSDLVLKKYATLLHPFGITILKDESSLDISPTVKVQITVAEIRRDKGLTYGLKLPEAYSATILNSGETVWEDLKLTVEAFEKNGIGKILASPNIMCRSGKEAEFLAGGEFPIKIMNYKVQDIVWKRYGILLRVKPKADSAGRISLSIETEVSTIDKATGVDGIPGILTNRVSSHFDLTRPQTIALSGLLKNEDSENSQGLPMLSRLPIIGALFSSKEFRDNRTELVIFVRPEILKEGDQNLKPQHLGELSEPR
ncbi:MAG: pilus assembly protein [Bdellovibrio sp.]